MLKAAQYLRMSTDKQRYSIANQEAAILAYASENGFEIIQSYTDEGRSGVTINRRDGLKALLRDVMSGAPFSTVLVLDVSRWGRFQDPDQAAHYEFLCREAGVSVRYCSEAFDDDGSATSSLVKSMKRVMAAEYSRQLSERCSASLRRHMLGGAKCGGTAPYGFARQIFHKDGAPGRILTNGERRGPDQTVRLVHGPKDEIDNVRMIFDLFVHGLMGPTAIAHHLNKLGRPYRRPGPWEQDRVRYILRNEIAAGIYSFNRVVSRFGKVTPNPPDRWIKIKVAEPLVSPKLYAAAQAKFAALDKGKMWTDEEMIERLRRLLLKHGYLTKTLMDRSIDVQGVGVYARRFGSVEVAWARVPYKSDKKRRQHVDAAGREPDEIIRRLKELYQEKGYLNLAAIQDSPRLPSIKFIYRRFGSIGAAYRAAGFDLTRGQMVLAGRQRGRRSEDQARYLTLSAPDSINAQLAVQSKASAACNELRAPYCSDPCKRPR